MKPSEDLFQLIKSLTKSEKRYFTIHNSSENKVYQKIFDLVEKQEKYKEKEIADQLAIKQLHVYKNYLHKLILKSLRSFYSEGSESIIIYNHMHSFEILFSKGLIKQAERELTKAKLLAEATHKKFILPEIYQLEQKLIFYKPHSKEKLSKVDFPRQQEILEEQLNIVRAQQLAYQITLHFYRTGYLINEEIKKDIEKINHTLDEINGQSNEFLIYKLWTKYIYYFIVGDFLAAVDVAEKFIPIVDNYKTAFELSVFSTEIAYSHIQCTIKIKEVNEYLMRHKILPDNFLIKLPEGHFAHNSIGIMNLYLFYEVGKYKEGLDYWKGLSLKQDEAEKNVLIITYHAACILNFCIGNYKEALKHCNWIINEFSPKGNYDFYITNLLLRIVIHFELGNYDIVEVLIKNIRDPLKEYNFFHPFDKLLLRKLKQAMQAETQKELIWHMQELDNEFVKLSPHIENLNKLKFYFDFKNWIKSKVLGKEFKDVIREAKMELLKMHPSSLET